MSLVSVELAHLCLPSRAAMLGESSVSAGLQICSWTRWIAVLSNRRLSLNQQFQVKNCAFCMHVATSGVFLLVHSVFVSKRSLRDGDFEGACWLLFLGALLVWVWLSTCHARPELCLPALPDVLRVRFFVKFACWLFSKYEMVPGSQRGAEGPWKRLLVALLSSSGNACSLRAPAHACAVASQWRAGAGVDLPAPTGDASGRPPPSFL